MALRMRLFSDQEVQIQIEEAALDKVVTNERLANLLPSDVLMRKDT